MENVCPACGAELQESYLYCPKCGAPLDGKRACPSCNRRIDADAVFCPYCGQRTDGKIVCANCGNILESDMAFCAKCGTPVQQKTAKSMRKSHLAMRCSEPLQNKILHIACLSATMIALLALFICSFVGIYAVIEQSGPKTLDINYFFGEQFRQLDAIRQLADSGVVEQQSALEGALLTQIIINTVVYAGNLIIVSAMLLYGVVKTISYLMDNSKKCNLGNCVITAIGSYAIMIATIRLSFADFVQDLNGQHWRVGLGDGAIAAFTIGAIALAIIYVAYVWQNKKRYLDPKQIWKSVAEFVGIILLVVGLHAISDGGSIIYDSEQAGISLFGIIQTGYLGKVTVSADIVTLSSFSIAFSVIGIGMFALTLTRTMRALFSDERNHLFVFSILSAIASICYAICLYQFLQMNQQNNIEVGNSTIVSILFAIMASIAAIFVYAMQANAFVDNNELRNNGLQKGPDSEGNL